METETERALLDNESGRAFISTVSNLDPDTASYYQYWLCNFLEWVGMDSEELYNEHRSRMRAEGEPRDRLWLSQKVAEYQRYLRDEAGYSQTIRGEVVATSTVTQPEKAVINFLKANGFGNMPKNGEAIIIETLETPEIQLDDLNKILEATGSYKMRAVILVARDSGLRLSDLTRLTVGVYQNAEEVEVESGEIFKTFDWRTWKRVGRKRRRPVAYPILTPQTIEAVDRWLEYRTEKLEIPIEPRSPLFCAERTMTGYTRGGKEIQGSQKGDQLSGGSLSASFSGFVDKAKIPRDPKTGRKISIHSLRVLNESRLSAGDFKLEYRLHMVGKSGGAHSGYNRSQTQEFVEAYSKASWALGTTGSRITKITEEFLEDKVEEKFKEYFKQEFGSEEVLRTWFEDKFGVYRGPRLKFKPPELAQTEVEEENKGLKEMLARMEARLKKLEENGQ